MHPYKIPPEEQSRGNASVRASHIPMMGEKRLVYIRFIPFMKEMIFLLRDSEIGAKYAYVFRNLSLSDIIVNSATLFYHSVSNG